MIYTFAVNYNYINLHIPLATIQKSVTLVIYLHNYNKQWIPAIHGLTIRGYLYLCIFLGSTYLGNSCWDGCLANDVENTG